MGTINLIYHYSSKGSRGMITYFGNNQFEEVMNSRLSVNIYNTVKVHNGHTQIWDSVVVHICI